MWVSMIMLAASVLPHHHHREILCLQHDVTACDETCPAHHQDDGSHEDHGCNAGCVTKFKSVTPDEAQDSVSPDYSFCLLLYACTGLLPAERGVPIYSGYLEKLHSTCLPYVKGLRAPPAGVLA